MGADIETGIPANVVEIGTEVTQGIIDALNTAPSPNATNRFAVINDLNLKANLTGATFTGKVTSTPSSLDTPPLNLGSANPTPLSAVNGDVWISNSATPKVCFKANGISYNIPSSNAYNTFTGTNIFPTQVATDNSTKVATTEFVRNSVPTTGDWNLLIASITVGSPYNVMIRLVWSGNSTIVFQPDNTIPVGAQWVFVNNTTHTRTFSAGVGANLYSQGNKFILNGQYSMCTVVKMATNDYYLSGNLV
jgi:hypothetical protein